MKLYVFVHNTVKCTTGIISVSMLEQLSCLIALVNIGQALILDINSPVDSEHSETSLLACCNCDFYIRDHEGLSFSGQP